MFVSVPVSGALGRAGSVSGNSSITVTSHICVVSLRHCIRHISYSGVSVCNVQVPSQLMEDIVDLADTSLFSSTQLPHEADCDREAGGLDMHCPLPTAPTAESRQGRGRGRARGTQSLPGPSPSHNSLPHKLRGPNWTESEMLVLIGQKRVEWDGRHNCGQPSLATDLQAPPWTNMSHKDDVASVDLQGKRHQCDHKSKDHVGSDTECGESTTSNGSRGVDKHGDHELAFIEVVHSAVRAQGCVVQWHHWQRRN